MDAAYLTLVLLLLIMGVLYVAFSLILYLGWRRLPAAAKALKSPGFVTILVAFRNESENIEKLLNSLYSQSFDKTMMEVILVNDGSTDDAEKKIGEFVNTHPEFKVKVIPMEGQGGSKKAALRAGILHAKGDWILTTDADCTMDTDWVDRMCNYALQQDVRLVIGPVAYTKISGGFNKMQTLEFLSLVASGAAFCAWNRPFMANGANLAFRKEDFTLGQEDKSLAELASGDDMQMVFAIKKRYGGRAICFARDSAAIVRTAPAVGFRGFYKQRIRWASKAKHFRDPIAVVVSVFVFIFNCVLLFSPLAAWYQCSLIFWSLGLFLCKFICDLPLLLAVSKFSGDRSLMRYYPLLQMLYPLYIVIAAIGGMIGKFSWKGKEYHQ
jgi:cellulose synthase/poly-beta-1,6-N-acetylglucosamine synthase-like glycosyltransferase